MPSLPEVSKTTSTVPASPGATGFLLYFGTVHPQLAVADVITRSASPVLVKGNIHPTLSPAFTAPKLCSSIVNVMTATPVVSDGMFLLSPDDPLPQDANSIAASPATTEIYLNLCFIL